MKKFLIPFFLLIFLNAQDFSKIREKNIIEINKIIDIYKNRLKCIENENIVNECIEKFPNNPKSDNLAKVFSSSFPKSFYINTLIRDIKILEKEKICWGKAINKSEAIKCLKN
ncbi:hypothetical protein [Nitrosophilus kaiyonis]|uniref:hypothetical protein n=1 Tax=Nitrosophilus kaiyonis TaxID=2930200 RepID=UPI002491E4B6|nr:hypothetical protein [Nitrosophilus kaiyonis]